MTPKFTTEFTTEDFATLGAPHLVYVRPITGADVLASTPVEAAAALNIQPDQILYAVHGANGACLAVLGDRDSAVAAALANEMAPVSVH